jgi:hypothetical protein
MNKYQIILLLCIIIIHILYPFLYTIFNKQNNYNGTIDIIIAHYKEDLKWVDDLPKHYNIYIYSKNNNKPNIKRNYNHILLSNVGRDYHTYLYHIINNYNKLADYNIFCAGSTHYISQKKFMLVNIIKNIGKYSFYSSSLRRYFDFLDDTIVSTMTTYKSTHPANRHKNDTLIGSKYKSVYEFKNKLINKKPIKYITYGGVFSISKQKILSNNIQLYKRLLDVLAKGENVKDGHYLERCWAHLFIN